MKIAFIGIGSVGFAIANNLEKNRHQIYIGHNDTHSESVRKAIEKNPAFKTLSIQEAVNNSDIIFLATPFRSNESVLKGIRFHGKTLVDCTNPVGPGISHALNSQKSGSEMVQEWASDARVVRAFNIYGYENLENNSFPDYNVKPVMPIAGNDGKAREEVSALLKELGFFPLDTGELSQSLHLEHMTLLWIKMVRKNGHHPNFAWAYIER